ncbi:hypothetical protein PG996_001497 [Apiospora saccharicola]|uniref:Uncharacterized protein n=1 Tax=Apiospora saccharicola TaxID=335842 RepID=A0ABR1WJP0_9PEZI
MDCHGSLLFLLPFSIGQAWGLQSTSALAPRPTPTHPYPPPPPNNDNALQTPNWTDPEDYCRVMSARVLESGLPTDKELSAWLEDHAATATTLKVEDTDVPEHLCERFCD